MITVFLPAPALDVVHLVGEVVPGRIHRPRRVIRSAGGKGINLARAAITFGAETVVVAPLGGHFGALVAELAAGEGIRMAITPSATETRTCLTVADEAGALTEFYEPSAVTGAELRLAAGRLAETPDDGWTVVSGSFPPGADLDHLAEVLSGRKRVALDCHGAALESLIGDVAPALVKINRSEAAQLLGSDGGALASARALVARGVTTAVVTDGADGAVAVDASGAWRAAPSAKFGRYPVGSGDSFFAGLLAQPDSESLPRRLATASAAGVANAQTPGAGRFSLREYDEALPTISVGPAE